MEIETEIFLKYRVLLFNCKYDRSVWKSQLLNINVYEGYNFLNYNRNLLCSIKCRNLHFSSMRNIPQMKFSVNGNYFAVLYTYHEFNENHNRNAIKKCKIIIYDIFFPAQYIANEYYSLPDNIDDECLSNCMTFNRKTVVNDESNVSKHQFFEYSFLCENGFNIDSFEDENNSTSELSAHDVNHSLEWYKHGQCVNILMIKFNAKMVFIEIIDKNVLAKNDDGFVNVLLGYVQHIQAIVEIILSLVPSVSVQIIDNCVFERSLDEDIGEMCVYNQSVWIDEYQWLITNVLKKYAFNIVSCGQ